MPMAPAPTTELEVRVWRVELGTDGGREAAREALGRILAAALGEVEAPALVAEENGKPRLAVGARRLSFNLSHSEGLALVAVAPGGVDVGVDVERIKERRRDLARIAARFMPRADALAVAAAPVEERPGVFYPAWSRYEARVKCTGVGLAGQAPGPEVTAVDLPIDAGYAAAVAIRDGSAAPAAPRIVVADWEG